MKYFLFTLLIIGISTTAAHAYQGQSIVAAVIAAEAANQGPRGMKLVAYTIANRARQQHKTPYQIVTARNQYYGYTAPHRNRLYFSVKATADRLAADIMTARDDSGGAIYFRQPREPRYSWHKVETLRYKNHIFYK